MSQLERMPSSKGERQIPSLQMDSQHNHIHNGSTNTYIHNHNTPESKKPIETSVSRNGQNAIEDGQKTQVNGNSYSFLSLNNFKIKWSK